MGPVGFGGGQQMAHGLQRTHENDTENSVCGKPKTFFFVFGDPIKIVRKVWHFSRLFWSSQNRRCLIFKLTPGPRLALSAPGYCTVYCITFIIHESFLNKIVQQLS